MLKSNMIDSTPLLAEEIGRRKIVAQTLLVIMMQISIDGHPNDRKPTIG